MRVCAKEVNTLLLVETLGN